MTDPTSTDAPDVWDATIPPGGHVCGVCGMPTESEPCREHQPRATAEMYAEVAPHDPEMHSTEIERISCDSCNPPLPPGQPEGQPR
ncbi:hypothetical protein [Amycolatopsis thermoflava]|uniref:hypothetical protein n=1 Tax=Amycolatopsis thermoflava TaxID=84480 RepID=UPI0003FA5701|nr:hypothetical protein [Amycolatopsis thermoflava]